MAIKYYNGYKVINMSVLIVELRDNHIGMCADCCRINIETGNRDENVYNKIEKVSNSIYVGHCGSAAVSSFCIDELKKAYANNTISKNDLSDTILFITLKYDYFIKLYPIVEQNGTTKFIVVGKSNADELTYTLIENSEEGIQSITYDNNDNKAFLCISPVDMDIKKCIEIISTEREKTLNEDIISSLENYMRQSVAVISQESNFVSEESIFYIYTNE